MSHRATLCSLLLLLAPPAFAQGPEPIEPIPAQIVIDDWREAYSKVVAEEVSIRFRSGTGERNDSFIVRIDPGAPVAGSPDGPRPRAILLELGSLRIHIAAGTLTAINTSAPDKFYLREFTGPITPLRVGELLPPLPIPQLAMACPGDPDFISPLTFLPGVSWSAGTVDETTRPHTITIRGSAPTGNIEIVSVLPSLRLQKVTATIRRAETEGTYELSIRAIEPGDPASWPISTQGRTRVASLSELRPVPRPLSPVTPGQPVPNISLSRFDMTGWSLHQVIESMQPPTPMALILVRAHAEPAKTQAAMNDARAALALVRAASLGEALAGESPPAPATKLVTAAAVIMEPGESTRSRWAELRRTWSEPPRAVSQGADELMWSTGAGESIDRFIPGASVVLVVVRPDKTLSAAIRVDGRPITEVAAEFRKALDAPR